MSTRGLAAVVAACMTLSAPAWAQAPDTLTLKEAVRQALDSSYALRGAMAKIAGVRAKQGEVNASNWPSVSVSVSPMHINILDPGLNALLTRMVPGLSLTRLSESLTVSQVLYDGGRSGLGLHATELSADMATQAARMARQNAAFEAANAYLNVLRAESLARAVAATRQQVERHLKDASLRERTGVGSRFDTLQAQTAFANLQDRLIQSRNAVKLARMTLSTATHQPLGARKLDPTPSLPAVTASEEEILRALEQRPEVEMANRQRQLDELTMDLTRRDYLPVAAVQGIVLAQGLEVPGYAVMGSANWTVFDGGKTESKLAQQQKTLEADEASLAALRDGLRLEVEKAIAERDEAKERMSAAEQSLKTAQAGFDLATLRYNEGAGTGTDVIDATSALSQAEAAFIQATYDELAAELKLAKALGIDLAQLLTR